MLIKTLTILKNKTLISPLNELFNVFHKIKPLVELKQVKLGSTKYLVPTPLTESRQFLLGLSY